jgi:hypothetical protein
LEISGKSVSCACCGDRYSSDQGVLRKEPKPWTEENYLEVPPAADKIALSR